MNSARHYGNWGDLVNGTDTIKVVNVATPVILALDIPNIYMKSQVEVVTPVNLNS